MTEEQWFARYGPWAALDVAGARALMSGFSEPWWVVGGYAIEAFSGVSREHEDVDIAFFFKDIAAFREHLGNRYHLWAVGSGALRPLDDRFPEMPAWAGQIWIREHALAPWLLDFNLQHKQDGLWVSKRDDTHRLQLEDVTWLHGDGVRYQNPEIVLLHKALEHRPKDLDDFHASWPMLSVAPRAWLREALTRLYPDHPWLPLFEPGG